MSPLNPFLFEFFRSNLQLRCNPVQHHILLVPQTSILLNYQDSVTNAPFSDLAGSNEFLASHVVRIPNGGPAPLVSSKSDRDLRGRARQYTTLNGRVLIIRDTTLYTNKGFKTPTQAQLLADTIYHPDTLDAPGWLVYYISRPLTGNPVPILRTLISSLAPEFPEPASRFSCESQRSRSSQKDGRSFGTFLYQNPRIAKQMKPGLDRILTELTLSLENDRPTISASAENGQKANGDRTSHSQVSSSGRALSVASSHIARSIRGQPVAFIELNEEAYGLQQALENAVDSAIHIFQTVGYSKITSVENFNPEDLSVERMIERYVVEHVNSILFPKVALHWYQPDKELEKITSQCRDIDVLQMGALCEIGWQGKHELWARLRNGISEFQDLALATSPQEMLGSLVRTLQTVTMQAIDGDQASKTYDSEKESIHNPYAEYTFTVDADTLVSLLLVVVVHSNVRSLHARFIYMRYFVFTDDMERGESGYALSTLEAVLSYLKQDRQSLVGISTRNRRLWNAVKKGDISLVQTLLQQEPPSDDDRQDTDTLVENGSPSSSSGCLREITNNGILSPLSKVDSQEADDEPGRSNGVAAGIENVPPRSKSVKKRVTMQLRSVSASSFNSSYSKAVPFDDGANRTDEAGAPEVLARIMHDHKKSLIMIAIENKRTELVRYFLSLPHLFTIDFILDDMTDDHTTLLSASIKLDQPVITDMLLDHILAEAPYQEMLVKYISIQDSQGRSIGHYLFHYPKLIKRLGHLVPWTQRDSLGQTPLLSLCRSYDHPEYRTMMDEALEAATKNGQKDGTSLDLSSHVDNKGNTLLHVVTDSGLASKLLRNCDMDVNLVNQRQMTPLMMVSKYGRSDIVRTLFRDPRVNVYAIDSRGFTAVDLAKDDDVRNRIDALILLSSPPGEEGRTTAVVRSYIADDNTVVLVLKSAIPIGDSSWSIATSSRTLSDFERLAGWLARENPASWIPEAGPFMSPLLVQSKPSRAVLRDIQIRLDHFLKSLLSHPTFSTHEMVWEFFLVPEMSPDQFEERSKRKAEAQIERVRDEFHPLLIPTDLERFAEHAIETIRSLSQPTKSLIQQVNLLKTHNTDLFEACQNFTPLLEGLGFIPESHVSAWDTFSNSFSPGEMSPLTTFYYDLEASVRSMSGIITALQRPKKLILELEAARKTEEKHQVSARRSERWPNLGIVDGAKLQKEALSRARASYEEQLQIGKELAYTQQVVAGELAGWQDQRHRVIRKSLRDLASRTISAEKTRLEAMIRATRSVGVKIDEGPNWERPIAVPGMDGSFIQPYQERRPGDPI